MEFLVASAIGVLTSAGLYLLFRMRTFPVILGISLLTYAVNVFLFTSGRLAVGAPPVLQKGVDGVIYSDPLPQALVLTAIVISFGMTAVVVMIALGAYLGGDDDKVNDAVDASTQPAEDAQ
ncbi:Na+/H+ antiporter subunit C [Roseobacter denitrificans]|uniref:pH adaption potassium efflux system protein n=1 Tax=Roseobacter denitrificans (strain ATCC 33942 / OCh 114) TaxID=375451 RepID=Q162R1_ROSDO|nr:Na+/H+ antiporter subunit C [Roseobacter denitrificans]ABG33032.1 pH adaption potassium efflux system protein [Roseobacter denitrificans OCh 114]AVL52409.1 Na+/H+ antiporter subunit C [Roseobacter denitrificans]SFG09185.1 multisubunit potassium/proton antiporter, PhaC subunit [Roseobacter denitrificans OCh 114]